MSSRVYMYSNSLSLSICNAFLLCSSTRAILRKHAYSNILKILPPKNENFQIKNSNIFHNSAQNIDCGYTLEPPRRKILIFFFHISALNIDCGYSLEPPCPQSMFLSRNKKNNVYPCKPRFYYIKVGFKGVKVIS